MTVMMRRSLEVAYGQPAGSAETVVFGWPERDGKIQTVLTTSGNEPVVNIYRDGESTTPTILQGAATVNDDGRMEYALDCSNKNVWGLGMSATAEFRYNVDGFDFPQTARVFFAVVRVPMIHNPPCSARDMFNAHVDVEETLKQMGFTDDAGDADPSCFIVEAWEETLQWLDKEGHQPGYILNPGDLAPMLRELARWKMFEALMQQNGDVWVQLRDSKRTNYRTLFASPPTLQYDPADARHAAISEPARRQPFIGLTSRAHARRRARLGGTL